MVDTISLDKVVDPGIKKHFVDAYKQLAPKLDKVFKTDEPQESLTDVLQDYTGIAGVSPVIEGGTYTEDAPIQSFGVSLTPVKFGKLIPVTMELMTWAKTKEIFNASAMLGKSMARHVEKRGASQYNNGFNTAYTSYRDGKPRFSTIHTRADGGTAQSNASATGITFGDTNLEVGLLAMENQLDDRGELISVFGNQLLIPNALRKQALVVTRSEGLSGSADNDVNVYNSMQEYFGGMMPIVVWNYLGAAAGGSDTAWFLKDSAVENDVWQWAKKPSVKRDDSIGFKQDVIYYKGMYYASMGWKNWRGSWGSKGDGQAYSS